MNKMLLSVSLGDECIVQTHVLFIYVRTIYEIIVRLCFHDIPVEIFIIYKASDLLLEVLRDCFYIGIFY